MILVNWTKRSTNVGSDKQMCLYNCVFFLQHPHMFVCVGVGVFVCVVVRAGVCVCGVGRCVLLCQTLVVPVWGGGVGGFCAPGKQCLVLSLVFYVSGRLWAQEALCGQEVSGLTPDRPVQLFTTVGHICVCACLCVRGHTHVCVPVDMHV